MSLDNAQNLNKDGSDCSFAIVASRFNGELVDALLNDVLRVFAENGVADSEVRVVRVPGASEIPSIASILATTYNYDVVIALGVVIAGETPHHEIIGNSTANALQRIALDTGVPVINGIIVANSREQAVARTTGSIRRGVEFGEAAIDMANVAADVLGEYMISEAQRGSDDDEIDDGFLEVEEDNFDSENFDSDFSDDFDEIESGGAVILPEDEIYEKGGAKKRNVKKNRKPRKG